MNHSPQVWALAVESLRAGRPAGLLYVLDSQGSSPGRAGFALTVTAEALAGSIGGGTMEVRLVNRARDLLTGGGSDFVLRQVHDAEAETEASGMICSGEQTVAFRTLGAADLPAAEGIAAALRQGPRGVLSLSAAGLTFDPDGVLAGARSYRPGPSWRYDEDLGRRDRLHVVGGGHCSLALCQLAAGLDFDITVYEDRPDLPTLAANSAAQRQVLVKDYADLGGLIADGPQQYVCVMTFGYKTDDKALRSLIFRDYGFLGVLGSRHKIDTLMAAYRAEGFPPERLRRLNAPLGLPIHSQTPAEIAVSVAAQLIRTRRSLV